MTADQKRLDLIQRLEAMSESLEQLRGDVAAWARDDLSLAMVGMPSQRSADAYSAGQYCIGKMATARMHVSQCADMLDDLGAMLNAQ